MPAPLGPIRRSVRELGLALITLGVVVLLFVGYQLIGTNFTEARNQSVLAKQFRASVPTASTTTSTSTAPTTAPGSLGLPVHPTPGPTPTTTPSQAADPQATAGQVVDHLVIPRLGLDKFVVEGTTDDALRRGPGHYPGTPYPGQMGNAAIAGHRTTYGAPFFDLNQLTPGDPIDITDLLGRTWIYKVSQPPEVVSPDDVAVLDPTPFAQLTLTTCNPRFSATSRLVVFAKLQGRAAPATVRPHPKIAQVAGADTPNLGGGRSSAWTPAIGYGAVTVVLWIFARLAINRTRRWRRFGAYVIGIGVCLIPLWFCFENLVLLLPQSI